MRARLPASTFALAVKEELCGLPPSRAELHGLIRAAGSLLLRPGGAVTVPGGGPSNPLDAHPDPGPSPSGRLSAVGPLRPGAPDPRPPISRLGAPTVALAAVRPGSPPRLPTPPGPRPAAPAVACEVRCARAVVARRAYSLFREVTGVRPLLLVRRSAGTADGRFLCRLTGAVDALTDLGLLDRAGRRRAGIPAVLRRPAQAPSLLRGFFLGAGSVDDPARDHHLEMDVDRGSPEVAGDLLAALAAVGVRGRSSLRRGRIVVYLKDAAAITTLLGVMGAGAALLAYEEQCIRRQVRGDVNRLVNAETANLGKAAAAGVEQARAARALRDAGMLETLPAGLRAVALARLHHPEASLRELGALLHPPLGKSGVQHRLALLQKLAQGREQS